MSEIMLKNSSHAGNSFLLKKLELGLLLLKKLNEACVKLSGRNHQSVVIVEATVKLIVPHLILCLKVMN